MEKTKINEFEIEIYSGYCGDQLFISKGDELVYSARVHRGDGMNRVREVLERETARAL